jgi:hypothetical protein
LSSENYVEDYYENNSSYRKNLDFLTGKIESKPDGDYIHNIHSKWFGDFSNLETHHGYIQWLFPLPIQGVNYEAHPLQKHELEVKIIEFK